MTAVAAEAPPTLTPDAAADKAEAILEHIVRVKGGTRREGQVQMAREVAHNLVAQKPLMAQGGTGIGKALDVDTPIPTPRGFVRMGDLEAGDTVYDEFGRPVTVTDAFAVMHGRPCFEITFNDGSTIVADADHEWTTVPSGLPDPAEPWRDATTTTTRDLATGRNIPLAPAILGARLRSAPISPYALGLWLAGTVGGSTTISMRSLGAPSTLEGFNTVRSDARRTVLEPDEETVLALKHLGVLDDKHIPAQYLFASVDERRALLAGLLDASGFVNKPARSTGQVQFTEVNSRLAADTQTLACGLGFRATLRERRRGGVRVTWMVTFTPDRPVFTAPAKNAPLDLDRPVQRKAHYRSIQAITPVPSRPVRCITVDSPTHLYLAGRTLIATHNSIAFIAGALASGKQTVIAPHTKALQDQLALDLDLVEKAFADGGPQGLLPHAPTSAVIKGRGAYLCLSKIRGGLDDAPTLDIADTAEPSGGPASGLGQEVAALSKWADETDTGDRSSVPFPVESRAWAQVSVSAENCTSKACPFYEECFAERARARAKEADIIVTNQAFLAMAMRIDTQVGRPVLLPDTVEAIVVDEAHELPAVVADTFGAQVTVDRLERAIKRTGPLDSLDEAKATTLRENATKAVEHLATKVDVPTQTDRSVLAEVIVLDILAGCESAFDALAKFSSLLPETDEEQKAKKTLLVRTLDNIVFDLRLLQLGTTDYQVAWAEPGGKYRDKLVLRSAQFDVAQRIYTTLIEPFRSVVFTSATLTVAGRFDQPAKDFGLTFGPWEGRVVPSPFDYQTQGLVWMPSGMPLPSPKPEAQEAYAAAVAEVAAKVAMAAGGRTLVLCTSRAAVGRVAAVLQDRLGPAHPVLIQEPGEPTKAIAERFTRDPRSVLVGTRTFWAGVSIEGDTCAAVVIDKIPFPSPGEPVVAARSEKADRSGGSGFREVSLPAALLTIVQGAGRLIRTVTDRGVVVLCDPRIHERGPHRKSYARDVRASLPPFPFTEDENKALTFLRQIDATANDKGAHVEVDETAA